MKRTRKTQTSEPSLRDRLTSQFIEALEKDWAQHGTSIIEKMRLESPTKYAEIVSRLVVPTEQPPAPNDFSSCQSQQDIMDLPRRRFPWELRGSISATLGTASRSAYGR